MKAHIVYLQAFTKEIAMDSVSFPVVFFIISVVIFVVVALVRTNSKKRACEELFQRNIASLPEALRDRYRACKVTDASWFNEVGNSLAIEEDDKLNPSERMLKEAWDAIDDAEALLREKDFSDSPDKLLRFAGFIDIAESKFISIDEQEELS